MAKDKAVVNISASLLPEEIRTQVGGSAVYNLNDLGSDNKWIYSLTIVGSSSEDLIKAAVPFLGQGTAEEGDTATVNSTDDVVFLFVKHSGTTDGTTKTTATLAIHLNTGTATGSASGDIILKPGECFWARLGHTQVDAINGDSSSGNIQAQVYAILDDGGV